MCVITWLHLSPSLCVPAFRSYSGLELRYGTTPFHLQRTMSAKETVFIITGASKGFGKQCALAFAARFPGSHFVLISRHRADLDHTGNELKKLSPSSSAQSIELDLSQVNGLDENLLSIFKSVQFKLASA